MRTTLITTCCLLVLCGCQGRTASKQVYTKSPFHTTPNKWEKPRIFHTPFNERWSDRIVVRRTPLTQVANEKVFSPNKAYWFSVTEPDFMKPGPHKLQINIYNERDYLVRLEILDIGHYMRYTKWINEKLLYVRAWCSRILGVDLIFDVEREQIIHKENINDGGIPFMQWQQAKNKNPN